MRRLVEANGGIHLWQQEERRKRSVGPGEWQSEGGAGKNEEKKGLGGGDVG